MNFVVVIKQINFLGYIGDWTEHKTYIKYEQTKQNDEKVCVAICIGMLSAYAQPLRGGGKLMLRYRTCSRQRLSRVRWSMRLANQ